MLLTDKPKESCKKSQTFERNTLSTKKSAPAKTYAQFSQNSSECLKLTIQFYRMRNKKNLKSSLYSFKGKAPLPISVDLSNGFKSIIFETDQRKISPFMWLFWEEQ